jgi:hypothetical protein
MLTSYVDAAECAGCLMFRQIVPRSSGRRSGRDHGRESSVLLDQLTLHHLVFGVTPRSLR